MKWFLAVLPTIVIIGVFWCWLKHQVPHVRRGIKCVNGFRNDTEGALSDADLVWAWQHAVDTVVNGYWVINALNAIDPNIKPVYHSSDLRAKDMNPECLGVRGVRGTVYHGDAGVTDDAHNIAIDITNSRVRNYASYEMENCIGMRLGFPMYNR
jgi:hypothetical protein